MINNTKAFEQFLLDGGIYSPDMYLTNESEDFSPEDAVNVAYINKFADRRKNSFKYAMIA